MKKQTNMKCTLIILMGLWACSVSLPAQDMSVLFQIGTEDQSAKEFAFGTPPFNYAQYRQQFDHRPAVFIVGQSSEKTAFPAVIPGPTDAWKGNSPCQTLVHFAIRAMDTPCPAQLELNYVETHPTGPPELKVNINGTVFIVRTPTGNSNDYLEDGLTSSKNLKSVIDIPEGVLHQGNNSISFQTKAGCWLVFDNIRLKTKLPLALSTPDSEVALSNVEFIPALIYGKRGELRQPFTMQVLNNGKQQRADVLIDGRALTSVTLRPGINLLEADIPEITEEKHITVSLKVKAKETGAHTLNVVPPKKWTVYLVQHTHTDIGYTRPQTEILAEHIRYIDYAIEFCEATENYPDDAKFRWVCEASWAVKEYLKTRPEPQINKLLKYIRNGQIEVTGMFFNLSDLIDENSFRAFLAPFKEFKKYDIPVVLAMQNDVHGLPWCLADYMPDLGIKYFSMGEHGDRALVPFDRPTVYKWESPSGKASYAFRPDHYHMGNFWGIHEGTHETLAPHVFDYLESLTNKDYPFDAIAVQYSGYWTDNAPPSTRECEIIKAWNEKYAWPKLRSALAREFMDYVTAKYDAQLPVLRKAHPDWWTDGAGSAAREAAATRQTSADMITIQGLLSMAKWKGQTLPAYTAEEIRQIQENLLFYMEHTYTAAESIRDPTCENTQVQWAEKLSFAWEALKHAQMLYEMSAGLLQPYLARSEHPTITFFNSLNWKRSGVVEVYIDHDLTNGGNAFSIVDESGKAMHTQLLRSRREGAYYAIYVEDIPPMGYKTARIMASTQKHPESPKVLLENHQLENAFYKIALDPQTGNIRSLYDKQLGMEMVDADSPWQLGAFVYETLGNREQMSRHTLTDYERKGLSETYIEAGINGPVYQSIHVNGKSGCCEAGAGVDMEIRLFHHEKRIELHYAMRKLPITDPDGVYVAFPFKLEQAKLYFDVQGGTVRSGEDQIDGTASDWNAVQHFVAARNDKAQFIVGSNLIPLFQMGGICTGQFQRHKTYEVPHVYSWVTNNYWTTNFKASQEGELKWSYYLTSNNTLPNSATTRFGWNSRIPVYARVMPAGKPNNLPESFSAFHFDRDNLLMTSAGLSAEEGYLLLNVRELDGEATPLHIIDGTGQHRPFSVVNLIEEPIETGVNETLFEPYANKFIKLKL
jgi:hypothetical protein